MKILLKRFDRLDCWRSFDVKQFILIAIVEKLTDLHNILIRQSIKELTTIVIGKDVGLFFD